MIAERIKHALADFESRTEIKPNYVYLGWAEWAEFAVHFETTAGVTAFVGMLYMGSGIMYVPKRNHLSVGI